LSIIFQKINMFIFQKKYCQKYLFLIISETFFCYFCKKTMKIKIDLYA